MNILVFSWRDPKHPLAGGAEQVMHEHMKGWVAKGHSVTLFASYQDGLREEESLDGIKIIRNGSQYLGVQVAGFFYYLKNRKNFDFVVDQFHGIPFFTPLFVSKPKLAVIQEPAREVWFTNPLPTPLNWLVGLLGYLLEPAIFLLYKNTYFMTGSASAKGEVAELGIPVKKITVVPHGVILAGKATDIRSKMSDVKTVTYLGIISKDKGIEDALHAFSLLKDFGKYRFWVTGRAETKSYEGRIKRLTKKLGLLGSVKFWGHVSNKKKFELLAKTDILINPSIREGWGLVNIEANSVGTPVVAYNSAGLVDSVSDGQSGIITRENSPSILAEEIESLLNDTAKYKKLSEGAVRWSKNFDWDKSRELSLKLVEKISNGKK